MNLELAESCIYIYDTGDLSNGDLLCIYILYILYYMDNTWEADGQDDCMVL